MGINMNYCENCNAAFDDERCPACGTKKLRPVQDDDFCFLIEDDVMRCNVVMGVLETNDIQYSAMPFGSGVEARAGRPLSNYRLYVPFGSLEKARAIMCDMESQRTEEWRSLLLENVKAFNIPQKLEKKLRKKLKLPADVDLIDYCVDIVKSANKIVDEERIGAQWRYVYCYSDGASATFNSETFEIIAIRKKTK